MKRVKSFIKNNLFGIIVFIMLFVMYIISIPQYYFINKYTLTFYLINYFKDGLVARGFLGTCFSLLGIVSLKSITTVLFIITTGFIGFISHLLNKFVKTFKKKISVFIAILFIFNPASFTLMYSRLEIGRFDLFIFILSIISVILIYKEKNLYLIPIFSIIGILIHENYLIWLSPLICMLLVYKYYKTKNKYFIRVLISNVLSLIGAFILIKCGKLPYADAITFTDVLTNRTDFTASYFSIIDYYYATPARTQEIFQISFSRHDTWDYIIAILSYLSFIVVSWNICFKYIFEKMKSKLIYLLMILSCSSSLLLFFVACDYGRWYMYLINALLVLIMFLYFEYKSVIMKNLNYIKKYIPYVIAISVIFIILYQSDEFYCLTYNRFDAIIDFFRQIFKL